MLIETERLSIRRLGPGDEEFMLELLNQPSFIRNIADRNVRTLEDAAAYIRNGPLISYDKFGFGIFLVTLKETAVPIGMCGLLKRDSLPDVDIGFAYLERFFGQGYAIEAARGVMEWGWNTAGLPRIIAITATHNESSIRLLGKLGMRFEGMIAFPGHGDTQLFGIERSPTTESVPAEHAAVSPSAR